MALKLLLADVAQKGDLKLMLGWILIYVLMVLSVAFSTLNGGVGPAFGMTSSIVFGFLLLISALTFLFRGRA